MIRDGTSSLVSLALAALVLGAVPQVRSGFPAALIAPAKQTVMGARSDPAASSVRATTSVPLDAFQDTLCLAAQSSPRDYLNEPVFTPFTRAPELKNREEVRRALVREYPQALKDAGLGGTTVVWMHIDECGGVANARVKQSSGSPAVDWAALRVAAMLRWTPGYRYERPVSVWVAIPIIFKSTTTPGPGDPAVPTAPATPTAARCEALEWPLSDCEAEIGRLLAPRDYYPLTVRNPSQIDELLKTLYPASLRQQGIGGTAWIRVQIDPGGFVTAAEIARESGHDELDRAALAVARALRFFPPRDLRGRYASVTIMVPIKF